jgi:hypothetical protein
LRGLSSCSDYAEAKSSPAGPADASAAADATAQDAPSVEAGDASGESGAANLLQNADFALGCAGWTVYGTGTTGAGVTAELDPVGRTVGPSCRVCRVSNFAGRVGLEQAAPRAVAAGDRLKGSIWAQAVPDAAAPQPATVYVGVRNVRDAPDNEESSGGGDIGPTSEWREAPQLLITTLEAGWVALSIEAEIPAGNACFRVDDARLEVDRP